MTKCSAGKSVWCPEGKGCLLMAAAYCCNCDDPLTPFDRTLRRQVGVVPGRQGLSPPCGGHRRLVRPLPVLAVGHAVGGAAAVRWCGPRLFHSPMFLHRNNKSLAGTSDIDLLPLLVTCEPGVERHGTATPVCCMACILSQHCIFAMTSEGKYVMWWNRLRR